MKKLRGRVVVAVTIAALLAAMIPEFDSAAAPSTYDKIVQAEKEKKQTENEKAKAEAEKKEVQGELNGLKITQGGLKNELDSLNGELEEAALRLTELETQIGAKNAEIAEAEATMADLQQKADEQYEAMKKRIQYSYEQSDSTYLDILLSCSSFGDFLNATDYLNMISDYDSKVIDKYEEAKAEVEAQKEVLDSEKEELEELKSQTEAEQERIGDLMTTVADQVALYAEQIKDAKGELQGIEEEIAKKEAEIAEQESDLEELYKLYQEELAKSKQAADGAWRDISEVTFEDGDRYLLANLIYCEAGGEIYEGKLAVGAVVINRVLSSCYPNTVTGVIYQKSQFSPVASGRLALALAQGKATESCYQAADAAMSGITNVGNCVYFRTPIPGLEGIRIGGHIFY
ncbi:MAG: cell wall hydrolase [Lachnospiraceae bacterium]|nr:cell wall hydrolase [Lachnospiraceae bacterium]